MQFILWKTHPLFLLINEDLINLLEKHGIKTNVIDLKSSDTTSTTETVKPKKETKEKTDQKEKQDQDTNKLKIQFFKDQEFSDWYSDVIVKSEMIEYYDISGCYILRPWSYQIWEHIQKFFDTKIKELGVENAYFPLFVSNKALNLEKDHVEGFKPEVAWVTKSGESDLAEPIAIRPTSETIMYPSYAKWIRSHRDLPLKLNQWTNVVRWEFKNPTPFIRTREFLWQEGHTAHTTCEDAAETVYQILDLYRQVYEDLLAVPVIPGKKTENEKFAGGYYTTTIETMITSNGKGIQCATSHHLGQNFSKMFGIKYLDEKQQDVFAWQTSWGLTTRTIGVMVMVHGDDKGLVLPPRVAPIQVVFVPIITTKDDPQLILDQVYKVEKSLKSIGVRTKVDDNEIHNPGFKFNHWELKGVPIRIEFGAKDMKAGQVTIATRLKKDEKEKLTVKFEEVNDTVLKLLDEIQRSMLEKARSLLESKMGEAEDFDTFFKLISEKRMVLTPWCGVQKCEENVKAKVKEVVTDKGSDEASSAKTLCIPFKQNPLNENDKCFFCKEKASTRVLWGRTY